MWMWRFQRGEEELSVGEQPGVRERRDLEQTEQVTLLPAEGQKLEGNFVSESLSEIQVQKNGDGVFEDFGNEGKDL